MKNYFFILLTLLITYTISGQDFIAITGKVTDADSKEILSGTYIVFKTQDNQVIKGTSTDDFGNFTLNTSRRGDFSLEVSYLGFQTKDIAIDIEDKDINLGDIELSAQADSLDEITILGSLEEKQRALNEQRNADNIKNVISADLIGRFPDLNVAEALQRVPGINIQRDKGEGSTVSVRGTPAHYTTIQINGEQIPSAQQSGARNEALDLIPADQLSRMEITKAPTPDMDGDAIGGVVNLQTPVARKKKIRLKAESALGYGDLSGDLNGIGKLRIDKRFFSSENVKEGKLGVILGGSFYQNNNAEDRIDAAWGGTETPVENLENSILTLDDYQYRVTQNLRTRIGATATIDYKFNDKHNLVFNYMYNRREDNDLRNRLRFDMDRGGSVYETLDSITDGRIRRDINIFDELKENHTYNLQGNHALGAWSIDWGAFYAKSQREFTSDRGDFARDEVTIIADNPGGIYNDVPYFRLSSEDESMYNPFLYNDFRRYEEDFETTDADHIVGKINIRKTFNFLNEYAGYFKFGAKVRSQTNSKYRDNQVFAFNDPNNLLNLEESFLRVLTGKEPDEFLNEDYRFGPLIGRNEFQNYIETNRRLLTTSDDAWDSQRLSLSDTYDAYEDIYAAYAMFHLQWNKLLILGGVRVEQTDVNYDAFEVVRVGIDVQGQPISGGSNYNFVLPNLHLKYSLDDYTNLRLSGVFNYARPNFVDLVPYVNYDADAVTLLIGNPELLPAEAFNLDAMYEKYFSNVGVISVGLFYKKINNFQFTRIDPSLAADFPGYPNTQGFQFEQEQNGEEALVAGVEVNFVRALNFLPGFLKHLSIDGNYTYTYSDAFTQDRDNISLPGQAEHTFNTALSGDFGNFTGRISANYNGTFVNSLASQAQDDIFQEHRLQLDANASYQFTKRLRIFTEFTNITNAPSVRYQGERNRISRIAYFGWLARLGLSYRI
ncbi:TonB-dependent receptor [Winogradskyella vidalii]|uniref:TonB-dependent receptor n=1 Tax=Winogradskyella vidalii TaxID=2615024 RepID=UPI0015CB155A|nr:TonB-dependent receptor [Winogradskyella vidalii]